MTDPSSAAPSRLRLFLEGLEDRLAPAVTALGTGPGGQPLVTVLDSNGAVVRSFLAYDAAFTGGVNVALGDVTGDGVADIVTGAGAGGAPHVKVFDGRTFAEVRSFYAYDTSFAGGVNVATTEVNGDGAADIVTGAGPGGGPHVKVFDGKTLTVLRSFYAYDAAFRGGVGVAVGDLNGDLLPDIITGAGPGGGPHIKVFDARTGAAAGSFFAYAPSFTGGVFLASGDVDGNGTTDLITGAGPGGGPHVRTWTAGPTPAVIGEFLASGGTARGGVVVGSVAGEGGAADRIAAGPGGGPVVNYDLAGRAIGTMVGVGAFGYTLSSTVPQPDLLIRYHTLSQVAPAGGAGRLEPVAGGGFRLTIKGVGSDTRVPWFDDVPGRGAGQDTLAAFVNQMWPRQYGGQGANAVLESLVGNDLIGELFHLTNPRLDPAAGTLTFDARSLEVGGGPAAPRDIDRLVLGLSPNDVTAAGASIPAVNRSAVRSYAVAAVGGSLAGTGTTGTLTLELPFDTTAHFTGVPNGDRFLETIDDFVARFPGRFGPATPNAAVVYQDEQGALRTVTLNLATARLENGNAVFDVTFTGPPAAGRLALPLLFVDSAAGPTAPVMPGPFTGNLIDVLFTSDAVVALKKELTLTNNGTRTVYPFLRDVNDGFYQGNVTDNWAYDSQPQDPHNQEYRGYVGYYDATNNNYYFGLQPGASVTINVPLVFWDGARIGVATDPTYFTNNLAVGAANINNPYQYYAFEMDGTTNTRRYIDQNPARVSGTNGDKPVVMYYHSNSSKAPAGEAPDQLAELTIRDPYQYVLNPNLPDPKKNSDYLGPLFNYDISFVDSIMLPVAMEAPDVPTGSNLPYGWVGAGQSTAEFQGAVQNFTSSNQAVNGLGQYFDGRGWNQFFVPDPAAMGSKLPATKNVFALSPLNLGVSAYYTGSNSGIQNHILASGGAWYETNTLSTGKINATQSVITDVDPAVISRLAVGMLTLNNNYFTPGTAIKTLGTNTIELTQPAAQTWPTGQSIAFVGSTFAGFSGSVTGNVLTLDDRTILPSLRSGMLVTSDGPGLAALTRIQDVQLAAGTITLVPTPGPITGKQNFTFSGAISDYAAEKLMALWYGWADYYVTYAASLNPYVGPIQNGSLGKDTRTLTFQNSDHLTDLVAGMAVTGPPGLSPNTTISRVDTTTNTVYLSTAATTANSGTYNFALPKPIPRSPEVKPLALDFSAAGPTEQNKANQFAPVVYAVMSAFNTIPPPTMPTTSASLNLMQNIVGGNVSVIANIGPALSPVWFDLTDEYRDESKSLERGVDNFGLVPESTNEWYPDPSVPTAGAKVNGQPAAFNLYNLDPYVWFVHKQLGVSGYAFSLDDDAADVGAFPSSTLKINIGGLAGLPQKAEWTIGAPYGPVHATATAVKVPGTDPKKNPDKITGLPTALLAQLGNPNVAQGALGALVLGPGVLPGTRVASKFLADQVLLDTKLGDIGTQPATYSFFGSVFATGTINPQGPNNNMITNVDPDIIKVMKAVTVDNALVPGALVVLGPGIQQAPIVTRVQHVDDVHNTVTLDQTLDISRAAGTYRFKFT